MSINPIFSAIKLFFFSSQQRKNQFMKSLKSLEREEQEESSSLGCNDSATANLVGMYSIVMDNWSDYKISIFIFFLLSIVNPFIFALYLFSFFSFFFHLHLFFISFLKIGLLFSSYLFFLFVFGQRPQIGTRTCRMGKNSVCLSICPSPPSWPLDTAGLPSNFLTVTIICYDNNKKLFWQWQKNFDNDKNNFWLWQNFLWQWHKFF